MPVDTFTLLFVALCGGGLCFGFWYFSEAQRVKRALAAAPITAIAQLREGDTVRVVGALKLGPRTLSSPLSGRPCAVFFVRVREQVGKNSREIFRESEAVEGIRSPTRCDAQASRSSHPRPAESAPK
jgi:hypothetical protein